MMSGVWILSIQKSAQVILNSVLLLAGTPDDPDYGWNRL